MHRLLLFGATGLVGQQVLRLALADELIEQIVAPTRRALAALPKLENPIINFDSMPATAEWWRADALICALGTTIGQAGSQQQFIRVDHDYVINLATLAREAGTPTFALVSSLGADASSRNFYLRVKGGVERDLATLGFPSLTIVRPSLLDGGPRPEKRPGEGIALILSHLFAPIIPRRYRAISTEKVARALLGAVKAGDPGAHVIQSDALQKL